MDNAQRIVLGRSTTDILCRVYICRFNNQVPIGMLVKKYTFLLSSSRNILLVKKIESLLHTASKKFEF